MYARLTLMTVLVGATAAADGLVDERTRTDWLDRTAHLENRGDDRAIGRSGERTRYQIVRATWRHYSDVPFAESPRYPAEARRVARLILIDCERACARNRQPVTFANVRWFYQHGGY
jgi:hypothetical protein